jgi:hypothetical protein
LFVCRYYNKQMRSLKVAAARENNTSVATLSQRCADGINH